MQTPFQVSLPRRIVLISAAGAFILWIILHAGELTSSQNGFIRFVLTALFSALILFRPKPARLPARDATEGVRSAHQVALVDPVLAGSLAGAFTGVMLLIWGLVFNIRQFEWLGMLLVLGGCLRWSLPGAYGRDIPPALLLLYWAHPLPSQIFGPLQLVMQRLSVNGTQWLLQGFNVRVWADGMVLRTAFSTYEIPAWCSGMRTATTVFLLSLGLGLLRRLRWFEIALLAAAALLQALVLNVLRISTMVMAAPSMEGKSGVDFLHDTAGMIVLAAVLIVYVEILLIGRFKRKLAALRQVTIESPIEHPPVWRYVGTFKWPALGSLLIASFTVAMSLRNHSEHRLQMMRDVALLARDADNLEQAELTARAVLEITPGDTAWRLSALRIMLMREKYAEVLAALDAIPEGDGRWSNEKNVLRSYALMALGRVEEAAALVQTLPAGIRDNNPRVSMVLAEMGFRADRPADVAANVPIAARWPPNRERVRKLYPYLRYHRKWESISESGSRAPFLQPEQALSALEAYMNLDRAGEMGTTLLAAIARWPRDPRLLEPLYYMAVKRIETRWEDRFAVHLRRSIQFENDVLYLHRLLSKCFALGRPDLAWFVHYRMLEVSPEHPLIYMNVVRHGEHWMAFRRRFLGLPSAAADDLVDFRLYYGFGVSLDRWRTLCEQVPFGRELSELGPAEFGKICLRKALELFRRLKEEDGLSMELQYEYVRALDLADEVERAKRVLADIPAPNDADMQRNRGVLSEICERREDWQGVYESLRGCLDAERPELSSLLRFCRAELKLGMGLMALNSAAETMRAFPHSGQAAATLAQALLTHDSPEQALFSLSRRDYRSHPEADFMEAQALYSTQRFTECESFCNARMMPKPAGAFGHTQHMRLPPAETVMLWHRIFVPSREELDRQTAELREEMRSMSSPFLRELAACWTAYAEAGGEGRVAEPDIWLECGRDRFEKGMALSQLMLLLCGDGRFAEARRACGMAAEFFPESYILRRFLISLSEVQETVVEAARRDCPQDPEIWLAELVLRTTAMGERPAEWGEDEALRQMKGIVEARRPVYSSAAMARAAEYCLRKGMPAAAAVAARDASARARGLLPAYVIAVRCAIGGHDREWALEAVKQGILASRRPVRAFYEKLVALKTVDGIAEGDADVVDALKHLRQADPDEALWAEMLGFVRFERGGWEVAEAVTQMLDALGRGSTNRLVYLVGGLASESLGNIERAAEILEQGLQKHPDDLEILNNLIYVLSSSPETLPRAEQMLPALLAKGRDNPRVLDTACAVLIRAGRPAEAEPLIAAIRARSEQGSRLWFRAGLHQAGILLGRDQAQAALDTLQSALSQSRGLPDEDVLAAGKLRDAIQEKLLSSSKPDRK